MSITFLFQIPTVGEPKLKLECVQVFPLFGNVMSVKPVRLSGSTRDALLLSFKDAKVIKKKKHFDTFHFYKPFSYYINHFKIFNKKSCCR